MTQAGSSAISAARSCSLEAPSADNARGLLYDAEVRNQNVRKRMTPIMFLWGSNLNFGQREKNTKEVFSVDFGHGVDENPDRQGARLELHGSAHPSRRI